MSDFQAGDRILAQWDGGRFWFPGVVHSVGEGSVAVQYDDGMSDIRPANRSSRSTGRRDRGSTRSGRATANGMLQGSWTSTKAAARSRSVSRTTAFARRRSAPAAGRS